MKIKFSGYLQIPNFSSEKEACGILIQLLNELLGVLNKEKKVASLGYFFRERLGPRERRTTFSILNQLHEQVGQRLDAIKGHRNPDSMSEEVMGTEFPQNPPVFTLAQQLLHSLDRFAHRQVVSSAGLPHATKVLLKLEARERFPERSDGEGEI